MDITYLGHSSFRLRGKIATVVTDPYTSDIGLKFPKHVAADIVTVSHGHADHNEVSQIEGSPYVVEGPGEYEVKGVDMVGIGSFHDEDKGVTRGKNTIYRIEMEGVSIVHLGDIGHVPTASQIEDMGVVHVLLVPVGGHYTIDAKQAIETITEIDPSVVIPMHYNRTELDQATFGEVKPLDEFLKLFGKEAVVPQPKFVITRDKIPTEMQLVILE